MQVIIVIAGLGLGKQSEEDAISAGMFAFKTQHFTPSKRKASIS